MRWNAGLAALAAAWGLVAVLAGAVDVDAGPLAFLRLTLAAVTLAAVSLLTGRAAASKQSITASKSYAPAHEYIFAPRVFTELQNAQAIVLPYDGVNPLPPQFCYLKPHYLDVQTIVGGDGSSRRGGVLGGRGTWSGSSM